MTATKTATSTSVSAKSDADQTTTGNGQSADEQVINELSKLDQIRDMLFGEQVSTLREHCQTLDKNLEKNISTLRSEMKSSIKELKKQIEQNFDLLQSRISTEEEERSGQSEFLNAAMTSINTDIITKIDLETKRIDDALSEQHQESARQLDKVSETLQDSKLDRKTLAKFFSQFAQELEGS